MPNNESVIRILPFVRDWIYLILGKYGPHKKSVSSFGFKRLALYFPKALLDKTSVVCVSKCPVPSLESFGISGIPGFDYGDVQGITYMDTYFIKKGQEGDEALHFHELIHIIQWDYFSADSMISLYAQDLIKYGYAESPLEKMAFQHQKRFTQGLKPYDVVGSIRAELDLSGYTSPLRGPDD